jgi:hypothetical protein
MYRSVGEHTIFPVTERSFKMWLKRNEDLNLPVQYSDEAFTYIIMKRPHGAAAAVVTTYIIDTVKEMMPAGTWSEVSLYSHTGCTAFSKPLLISVTPLHSPTPKNKNADSCIFTWQSGREYYWPGVAVEVGYSDSHAKSPRDTALWVDFSQGNALSYEKCA